MLPENTAVQILAVFSSFGIIYFLYFYFSQVLIPKILYFLIILPKIHGFSIKTAAAKYFSSSKLLEKSEDLEEKLLNDEESSPLNKKIPEEFELLDKIHNKISSENRMAFFISSLFAIGFGFLIFIFIAVKF